jgi:hypothetical protein
MALDFPNNPSLGQVYGDYTWTGEEWIFTPASGGGGGGSPSNTNPIMDGVASPGTSDLYSRGDHVHPSDTSRASVAYVDSQDALKASITYVDSQDALKAPVSHTHTASQVTDFPEAVDDRVAALLVAGTNVTVTYNDVANTLTIASSGGSGGGIAEAPSDGKAYGRLNAAWAQVLPITGGTLTGGITTPAGSINQLGDIYAIRDGTHGVVYFGSSGAQYIYFDGAAFQFTHSANFATSPTAPTPAAADNTAKMATTAFVAAAISAAMGAVSSFPAGTVMLFYQAAAPTGWTKLTTQNDKVLRVVSGAGGVAGGTNSFSSVMAQTVVGNTTLSVAQLPVHNHTVPQSTNGGVLGNVTGGSANFWYAYAGTFNSGDTGGAGAHNHTINMAIQYIDLILASKN